MDRKSTRKTRPLRLESLEQRRLLAVAEFAFELYADDQGVVGEPLDADGSIQVGDVVHVAVTAREFLPTQVGLTGVSLDLQWDPEVLELIEATAAEDLVTEDLPLYRGGTIDASAGSIRNLRGLAAPGIAGRPIGNLAPEQFAMLTFRAQQATDGVALEMTQGDSGITTAATASFADSQLDFAAETIVVTEQDTGALPDDTSTGGRRPRWTQTSGRPPAEGEPEAEPIAANGGGAAAASQARTEADTTTPAETELPPVAKAVACFAVDTLTTELAENMSAEDTIVEPTVAQDLLVEPQARATGTPPAAEAESTGNTDPPADTYAQQYADRVDHMTDVLFSVYGQWGPEQEERLRALIALLADEQLQRQDVEWGAA